MAGNAVVGALRVVLGADTVSLEEGLKSAEGMVGKFATGFGVAGAAAAAAFMAAGGSIAIMVKNAIDGADKLNKLSQSVGMPVEKLSALKYAAELSDLSIEQLGTSLGKLGKNLTEAAAKPTSEAANAFKALGVATTDANGKLRSQDDVLLDIAEKFSGLKDGAGKTAVAMAIFGRAGASMIPFLNQGRDGLKSMTDRAAELGLVINSETSGRAEKFNDTLKDMGMVSKGVAIQVASQLLPTLQNLAGRFSNLFANGDSVTAIANGISTVFIGMANQAELLTVRLSRLGITWDAFKNAIANGIIDRKPWDDFFATIAENQKVMADTRWRQSMELYADGLGFVGNSAAASGKQLKDFNFAAMGGKNALQAFFDSTAKRGAALEAEAASIGKTAFEQDKLRITLEALTIAKNNHIAVTDGLRAKIDATALAFATLSEKATFGKQLFEQTRTPTEQFALAMQQLNGALERGSITWELYQRGVTNAQNTLFPALGGIIKQGGDLTVQMDQAGASIANNISSNMVDLAMGAKTAKEAFRDMALGIIKSILNMTSQMLIAYPIALMLRTALGSFIPGGGAAPGMPLNILPGRAMGGGVNARSPYIVGERGPELFVPGVGGQIVSNRDMQGGRGGGSTRLVVEDHVGVRVEKLSENRVRLIAREIADEQIGRRTPSLVAGQVADPSSAIGKSIRRNTTASPRR